MANLSKFKNIHAWYETKIPSTNKTVFYRAMLMKENMEISLALTENENSGMETVYDILSDCVKEDINLKEHPMYDIEWFLLMTQKKAQGETKSLTFPCGECNESNLVKIDLNTAKVINIEEAEKLKIIKVGDENNSFFIEMKYPAFALKSTIDALSESDEDDTETKMAAMVDIFANCISKVYDDEDVTEFEESSIDEWRDFVMNMDATVIENMSAFFNVTPKCVIEMNYTCRHCDAKINKIIEDINNFF